MGDWMDVDLPDWIITVSGSVAITMKVEAAAWAGAEADHRPSLSAL